jgi:tetratricopeptide (TPR) repeat protein
MSRPSAYRHQLTQDQREGRVEAQFDLSLDAIKKREMQAIKKGDEHDRTAARDAPELLRTFAFMHREKVRYEFLKLCAENPKKERAMESAETEVSSATQSWGQYFLEKLLWFSNAPNRHPSSTVLPDVLRQARNTGRLDGIRVRRAMKYLRSYSLVTHDEETDSWSMHPLIQRWAREGYESNPGEHHVWFHAAATLVSSCIVLTDTNNGNEELMRQLLPHVSTVRERQKALKNRVTENQYGRNKWYPVLDWGVKTHLLLMYAKFSMVYVSVGMFHEASELQRVVHRALESLRGYENSKTRRMSIFWARSLWALGRADEAAKLTEKLMDNCQRIFGPDHQETHVASIKLAHARLAQGRVIEARALCDRSVPELEKQCGPEDDKTLDALDIYAMAILLTGRPGAVERAKSLNRRTWKTRERLLGAEHVDTLASRQSFHATSFWDGNQVKHREAEEGMEEVARLFSKRLGREHPFTLLSMLYLARVKVELQDFDGAQQLFDQGLPIAERNLAEDHIAVLFCRYHIGRMRVRQGRWREARDELVDVSARQSIALQGWGRFHHDRIGTLIELARAHHELGEYDECDAVVEEAFEGFARNTGPVHPWAERLRADWEGWKRQRNPQLLTASSIERAVT